MPLAVRKQWRQRTFGESRYSAACSTGVSSLHRIGEPAVAPFD